MLLSIVIPSYNHAKYIERTLMAAAKINVHDKEIIVVDDGSPDNSVSIIREFMAGKGAGCNITLIARENRGLVRSLNEGLSITQGKYIYLVASDDIPNPEGIKILVECLEANNSLQFVMGNALNMDSETQQEFEPVFREDHLRFFALSHERRNREMFLNFPHPLLLQASVFKTSMLKDMGGWREDIISDDFTMFLRLFSLVKEVGVDFSYRPDVMACYYRRHESNISKNFCRQFMTVDQVYTQLCPPEFRDMAYLRNFMSNGYVAFRIGKRSEAKQILSASVRQIGILRWLYAGVPVFLTCLVPSWIKSLLIKMSILSVRKNLVKHESAAAMIENVCRQ